MPLYTSEFGPVQTRYQLENAVIATAQTWILYYLAEVERALGLTARTIPAPPDPKSYSGGIDFDTWMQEFEPCIKVVCQPVGQAERVEAGRYGQTYDIQVAAICVENAQFVDAAADTVDYSEDPARHLADLYGAALQLLLTQQGGFGSGPVPDEESAATEEVVTETHLFSAPRTEWVNPTVRRVARSITTVRSFVYPIADQFLGPRTPSGNPYNAPGNFPNVATVGYTLNTEDTAGNLTPATGAVVTDDDGDVILNELHSYFSSPSGYVVKSRSHADQPPNRRSLNTQEKA